MSKNQLSFAIKLKELGEYEKAQEWLNKFLKTDSNNVEALSLLSQVLLLNKKYGDAEYFLSKAIKLSPNHPSVRRNEIRLLLNHSKFSEALEKAKILYDTSKDDPENTFILSSCLLANQKDNEALILIEKVLKIIPNYAEGYANRSLIRFRSKDIKGAIEDAKMSVSIKPHAINFWSLLVTFYYKNEDLEATIIAAKKLSELEPENTNFMFSLGGFLKESGKFLEAITIFNRIASLEPKNTNVMNELGEIYQQVGQIDDANIIYKKSLAINPESYKILFNLGVIANKLNDLHSAVQYFEEALEIKPDLWEAYINLALAFQGLGELKASELISRKAIKLKPDNPKIHCTLGIILSKLHRQEEALKSFQKALLLSPDYVDAHMNIGTTLHKMDRLEDAEKSFNQAIILKPDSVDIRMLRWKLLYQKGEYEYALRDSDHLNTPLSRQRSLEALYALGQTEDVYQRIEKHSRIYDLNLYTEAFSSFLNKIEKKKTANNFCSNPVDFIYYNNILSRHIDPDTFIDEIIEDLKNIKTTWEPYEKATHNGFQTPNSINLFANKSKKIALLKSIIISELDLYYERFKNENCSYIQKWPSKKRLFGWHVILKQQGYQTPHIHPSGWLSGVVYLKVVPSLEKDEGAIELSLNGENYSNTNSPKLTYLPKVGDIVFFPSSLHHRTIPFSTDTDRIIISFDLMAK